MKGKSLVAADFNGKFSNDATEGAELRVHMQIQDSTVITIFYEYKNRKQAVLPQNKYVNAIFKSSKGELADVKQILYNNMMVDTDQNMYDFLLSMKEPQEMRVEMQVADKNNHSVYIATIDTAGLFEALNKSRM